MTELRPPPQWAHLKDHFLKKGDRSAKRVFVWVFATCPEGVGFWMDGAKGILPSAMADRGWTYLSPAVAITADDAQMERVARAIWEKRYAASIAGNPDNGFDYAKFLATETEDGGNGRYLAAMEQARAVLAALIGEK